MLKPMLMVAAFLSAPAVVPFHYILVRGHSLIAANEMNVRVHVPADFRLLPPTSRHASFDGHPYEVSLAAAVAGDTAIMVHAERVVDHSGHSNYDNLPSSPWPHYRLRAQCASIGRSDVAGEHDLKWLADRGWSPIGNLALEQHLRSSPDHNREVVISLIAKVPDCADRKDVADRLSKLRSLVEVEGD